MEGHLAEMSPSRHSTNDSDPDMTSASSVSSDSLDFQRTKRERPRRHASRLSFADLDSPPREPVLKVIRRPGKRGRPPRRWVYSDSDDVLFDEPKDKLVKRLSRNENEKMRRDRLNTYVAELAHLLPMVVAANRKMEKSSILRLAVNFLRVNNDFVTNGVKSEPIWNHLNPESINRLIMECNGDFLMASTKKGVITFASEGIASSLGHKLVDVLGQSIFELIHPDDQELYVQQFNELESNKRQYSVRLLNNLSNDQQQYILVTFQGYIKRVQPMQSPLFKGKEDDSLYLIAIGKLPHRYQSIEDLKPKVPCSFSTYMVYHNAFGEIQYLDPRSALLTGFMPYELVGKDAYRLVPEDDLPLVAHSHYKLLTEDVVTTIYRAYTKVGKLHYLKTVTHKVLHSWTKKIQYLISVNEIVSEEVGKQLLKEFIQQKKVDELEEEMKTKFSKSPKTPEICQADSTITSTSQSETETSQTDSDPSNPYDIPNIRAYLPRLWDLCKRYNEESIMDNIGASADSTQSVCTSVKNEPDADDYGGQLRTEKSTPVSSSVATNDSAANETVKRVPHRLRSLIRPVSQGCVTKPVPQRYKTCTKAYRSNKLSSLLNNKAKELNGSLKNEKDCSQDAVPDPEPGTSSSSDNGESGSNEAQELCIQELSFCDQLANIKSPQLPLWTRQHEMRQESQRPLLYKMLKQMEEDEQQMGMHQSAAACESEGKSQDDGMSP